MESSNSYILYHATSSLFIENIIKEGLNINRKWLDTKEILVNILSKLFDKFPEIKDEYSDKNFIPGIITQANSSMYMNYSHEHIYINCSKNFCLKHLFYNRYGSEIFSIVRKYYENEKYLNWLNTNYEIKDDVKNLLTVKKIEPYIVKITINKKDVLSILEWENGHPVKDLILIEMESSHGSYRIKKEKLPYKIICYYKPDIKEIEANKDFKYDDKNNR
jgi:LysM repeat protein